MLCSAVQEKKMKRCFLDLGFRGQVWGPQGHRQQRVGASSKYFPKTKPGGIVLTLLTVLTDVQLTPQPCISAHGWQRSATHGCHPRSKPV